MKKALLAFAIVAFVACNDNAATTETKDTTAVAPAPDTTAPKVDTSAVKADTTKAAADTTKK